MDFDVVGIRAVDDHWKKMQKVWIACDQVGIDPPEEVEEFFNGRAFDNAEIEVELGDCAQLYGEEGIQVCLKELPKNLTHLRFISNR